jgi:hypothetical protein
MSEELNFHPYNWHWIRVSYILDNGNFIEDTAYFCVKAGVDSSVRRQLFEGKTNNGVLCECIKEGEKVTLNVYFGYQLKYYWYDRIGNNDTTTYKPNFLTIENDDECIVVEFQFQPYYWKPYRDPNAPIAAAIFGIFGGVATALTLGAAAPALLAAGVGVSGACAATGLSPIAVAVLSLGTAGGVSSYYETARTGEFTVNMPTINISQQEYNRLSSYEKRNVSYTEFYTPVSRQTLLHKLKNEDIDSVRRQYPRLFSK